MVRDNLCKSSPTLIEWQQNYICAYHHNCLFPLKVLYIWVWVKCHSKLSKNNFLCKGVTISNRFNVWETSKLTTRDGLPWLSETHLRHCERWTKATQLITYLCKPRLPARLGRALYDTAPDFSMFTLIRCIQLLHVVGSTQCKVQGGIFINGYIMVLSHLGYCT